jgi:hypothetical protein
LLFVAKLQKFVFLLKSKGYALINWHTNPNPANKLHYSQAAQAGANSAAQLE